jgi:ureidoacrylate peracid hydrolase
VHLRYREKAEELIMAQFPIEPSKTAMLFFDTLNVYLHPEKPEARAAVEASGIVGRMQQLLEASRAAGLSIFYGQADHRPDRRDFASLIVDAGYDDPSGGARRTVGTASHAGEWKAEIIDELAPRPEDYVIKKHRWSTFFQTHLELSLRTAGIDTIIMCGGSTEVGIASTAYSARDRDFNQIFVRDACSSNKPGVNEFFMDRVFPGFGRVRTTEQIVQELRG